MVKHTKSVKGSLVKGVLENIPRESFERIADAIEKTMKGESGIYALYKNDRLYYVGLARDLKGRVKKHTRDKHAGKWNKFSIYTIKKAKYLGDVETIILRIGKPKGNDQLGRIPKLRALQKILVKEAKKKVKESKDAVKEANEKVKESKEEEKNLKKLTSDLRKRSRIKKTKKKTSRRTTRKKTKGKK